MNRGSRKFGNPGPRDRKSRGRQEIRSQRRRVLILCEGKKTEPGYFKLFRVHPTVRELDIRGEGMNTRSLVEEAEEIEEREGRFDEAWCVFDRDSFKPDDYDNAINKVASKPRYHAAYSNEAFELWFVLHFEYLNSAIDRDQYRAKLSVKLGCRYEKNDPALYRRIQDEGDENQAMAWAERLLVEHPSATPHSQKCPCTTVHLLVGKLRAWEQESQPA